MKNFWKGKKVIVTGATGFIGAHAIHGLLKREAFVTAIVSSAVKKEGILQNVKGQKVKVITADLLDPYQCEKVVTNQEVILNFAALDGGASFKQQYPARIFDINTTLILNILRAAQKNKVGRVLLMSSTEVYPTDKKGVFTEKDAFISAQDDLTRSYAWAKRLSEIAAQMYYREYGMKITIVRPGNVYGPGDSSDKGRVIPTVFKRAINNEEIIIIGDVRKKISFIHVNDLIPVVFQLVENYAVCDPVNIVSKQYITLLELVKKIKNITHSVSTISYIAQAKKTPTKIVSTAKLEGLITFKENITLQKGLEEFYETVKT